MTTPDSRPGPERTPARDAARCPRPQFAEHALVHLLDDAAETCARAMASCPPMGYLAHQGDGVMDFDIVAPDRIPPDHALNTQRELRTLLQRAGQQIGFLLLSLDGFLAQAMTGALIRVVTQGPTGAVICAQVLPREHLVSAHCHLPYPAGSGPLLTERPGVRAVDISLSKLSDTLRERAGVETLNLGGWHTPHPDPLDESALPAAAARPAAHLDEATETSSTDDVPARVLAEALHPKRLQFLALAGPDGVLAAADLLEDTSLNHFASRLAPEPRRQLYRTVAQRYPGIRRQLSRAVRPVTGDMLERVVLDVEQGALFVHIIDSQRYLLGVTLLQKRVQESDDDLARLVTRLRPGFTGGTPFDG